MVNFWLKFLVGPLPAALQNLQHDALRATSCDCLSNIGAEVFEHLPRDKRILCITVVLGLTKDDDNHVRAAAIRTLGVYILYPSLREDASFVSDAADAILISTEDSNLGVRMKAAWSLGNLSDALVLNKEKELEEFMQEFSPCLLQHLFLTAIKAAQDNDKVRSNGVRALGNLLRYLGPENLEKSNFSSIVQQSVDALMKNVSSGAMKVRWNACYAIGNMFGNDSLKLDNASWMPQVISCLLLAVKECKNFKVRINAAIALSVPNKRAFYGSTEQFSNIWKCLVEALNSANSVADLSEFKYKDNLTDQICATLAHLASLVTLEDLSCLQTVLYDSMDIILTYMEKYAVHILNSENEAKNKVSVLVGAASHISSVIGLPLDKSQLSSAQLLAKIFTQHSTF